MTTDAAPKAVLARAREALHGADTAARIAELRSAVTGGGQWTEEQIAEVGGLLLQALAGAGVSRALLELAYDFASHHVVAARRRDQAARQRDEARQALSIITTPKPRVRVRAGSRRA